MCCNCCENFSSIGPSQLSECLLTAICWPKGKLIFELRCLPLRTLTVQLRCVGASLQLPPFLLPGMFLLILLIFVRKISLSSETDCLRDLFLLKYLFCLSSGLNLTCLCWSTLKMCPAGGWELPACPVTSSHRARISS